MRAAGIATQAASIPRALAGLTTQQRDIIVLASRGLTKSHIGERLFLSPRTVESHLYRSYPKLGMAGRHQLRDLIDEAVSAPLTNRKPKGQRGTLLTIPRS